MKLLVNEELLPVSPSLSARNGMEEALLLQYLSYRLETEGVSKEGLFGIAKPIRIGRSNASFGTFLKSEGS